MLITGATDGIGRMTASLFAALPETRVIIHGRSDEKLSKARDFILARNSEANIIALNADLSTVRGAKDLATAVISKIDSLDILCNNAGVFTTEFCKTEDQLEATFAVNVLAPYILTCSLLPLLRQSDDARILNVASISQGGKLELDNLSFEKGGWSSHSSYSRSKLGMAAFSHELAARIPVEDAVVSSCDPGTVNTKMLLAGWGPCGIRVEEARDEFNLLTLPKEEARSQLHGRYFVSCRESRCCSDVYDDTLREGLWKRLEELSGVSLPH